MALNLSTLFFSLSNLAVAPFYLLMLAAPRAADKHDLKLTYENHPSPPDPDRA